VRDFAQVKKKKKVDREIAEKALDMLEIDQKGLDRTDRKLLMTIIEKFKGGPVGLNTLAAAISEDTGTIEDVYEQFLIQAGFLERTSRGRKATEEAYKHLKLDKEQNPPKGQLSFGKLNRAKGSPR
jgi:Holliday junction DNA helicase RuvB